MMASFRLKEPRAVRPTLPTFPAFIASQATALDAGLDGTEANETEIFKPGDLGRRARPKYLLLLLKSSRVLCQSFHEAAAKQNLHTRESTV
jgi:hypothetical protein